MWACEADDDCHDVGARGRDVDGDGCAVSVDIDSHADGVDDDHTDEHNHEVRGERQMQR